MNTTSNAEFLRLQARVAVLEPVYVMKDGVHTKQRMSNGVMYTYSTAAPYDIMTIKDQHGREIDSYNIEWRASEM